TLLHIVLPASIGKPRPGPNCGVPARFRSKVFPPVAIDSTMACWTAITRQFAGLMHPGYDNPGEPLPVPSNADDRISPKPKVARDSPSLAGAHIWLGEHHSGSAAGAAALTGAPSARCGNSGTFSDFGLGVRHETADSGQTGRRMTIQGSIKVAGSRRHAADVRGQEGRADHWTVLRGLLPFVWPKGRPDLRLKVVMAFAVLILAKLVTVAVPVFFKQATDLLASSSGEAGLSLGQGVGLGAAALILAYGTGRVLMLVLNQIRDVFFTKVGQHAVRELNNRTFQHLHRLSLRFHLER